MQKHSDSYINESTYEVTTSISSLTLDLSLYKNFFITLGADLTTLTLSNIKKSWTYHFVFIQGSTAYSVTLPAAMVTKGDIQGAINKSNTITDVIFKAHSASSLVQASAGASVSVKDEVATWIATASQTDFVVPNAVDNEIYDEYLVTSGGQIQLNVAGGNQAYSIVTTTNTRDTLRLSEGVSAGTEVTIRYRKEEQVTIISGDTYTKTYNWTWSEGTSGGGDTYMDFVISTATGNNEIYNLSSCQVYIDKVIQTGNYSIQTTTYTNDTLRIVAASGAKDSTTEVKLIYNSVGLVSNIASDVGYTNTTSGLTAVTVQAAIDEVEGRLDTAETNHTNHLNDTTDAHDATAISYSNTTSGLTATEVNAAIDEVGSTRVTSVIDITNAQALALNTTPKTLVAAGGTNILNIPKKIVIKHTYATAAFATNTTLQVGIGSVYIDLTTTILTATATQIDVEDIGALFANVSANSAITLKVKTGDPTAGGGTLNVWLTYDKLVIG